MVFFLVRRFAVRPTTMQQNERTMLHEEVREGSVRRDSLIVGGFIILGNFGEGGAGFAVNSITASFTLSTPGALLLVGSGILAYLAARNDRESQVRSRDFETSEPGIDFVGPPVPGIVPKMDLGDYEDHKNDDPA